jgi:hypothetical protein
MPTLFEDVPDDNHGPRAGEYLRDRALGLYRTWRPHLIRRLQRAFLQHILDHGSATSDSIRALIPIPTGTDPRIVGSVVRGLAEHRLIHSIGRRKSRRPEAHARKVDLWAVIDSAKAMAWLMTHPDP